MEQTNEGIDVLDAAKAISMKQLENLEEKEQYEVSKQELLHAEFDSAWYSRAKTNATPAETQAAEVVFRIREHERENLFGNRPGEALPELKTRDMGGQFLTNRRRIEDSRLFRIAQGMPKGCHLHIHFNSELQPDVLLQKARTMEKTMFVRSTRPLRTPTDYEEAEMVFNVLPEDTATSNIFSRKYNPDFKAPGSSPWMKWSTFRTHFPLESEVAKHSSGVEDWIKTKMVITEEDTYDPHQTHNGIWACFNQGTRCFKGLLNYESIYRWYIGAAIDSMIRDKIMYAELRPMLMDKSIPSDDGQRLLDLSDQMKIILEEAEKKKTELMRKGELHKFPFGLKVIYCTPRSIPKSRMRTELEDCIKLKLAYPGLICGFDLVGAEDRPNNIGFYRDELLAFTKSCETLNIRIPFMFHAGETLLDTGGSRDPKNSNLYDALLLNASRIGHGFSLMKHPRLVEEYKRNNICIEVCPISNELLHLCRNVKEHPFPQLLAAGLHCTINSDNPSLFR
ncbi:hypothetical protein LTR04_000302 [Oleoguttula sp. CCFEE 6159]|nr:hypothetical protein LTR04_000302 [Oleoguttula sp. CCFEE 6159]